MNTSSSLSRSENSAGAANVVKLCIFPPRIFAKGSQSRGECGEKEEGLSAEAEGATDRTERVAASLTLCSKLKLVSTKDSTWVLEKVEQRRRKVPSNLLSLCRSFRLPFRGSGGGGVTVEGNSFPESSYVPPSSKKESPESNKGSGDCVARPARVGTYIE